MTPILAARGVRVVYGGRAVLAVPSLEIADGAHAAIMGPNGAGKSTLLRILALLERPTRGEVMFRGAPVPRRGAHALALRRRIAVVLQSSPLADTTVSRNVAMGLQFRGVDRAERGRRVGRWLERFGIAHLAGRRARSLSGGEAQRTALARAFVLEPDVLLLDEPFAALDGPTRSSLLGDLELILREAQTTVVAVTHQREDAMRLADMLVVLVDGTLRAAGAKDALLRCPPNRETAGLFGFVVLTRRGMAVALPPGELALGPGPVTFELEVQQVIELGYRRRLIGRVGDTTIELDVPADEGMPTPGERVPISARGAVPLP